MRLGQPAEWQHPCPPGSPDRVRVRHELAAATAHRRSTASRASRTQGTRRPRALVARGSSNWWTGRSSASARICAHSSLCAPPPPKRTEPKSCRRTPRRAGTQPRQVERDTFHDGADEVTAIVMQREADERTRGHRRSGSGAIEPSSHGRKCTPSASRRDRCRRRRVRRRSVAVAEQPHRPLERPPADTVLGHARSTSRQRARHAEDARTEITSGARRCG